ncbi:MAG TPA: bifunctional 3,4-dihydroxy-2-butanone-4-phosphate synthase/GTP cyclohydrolase II [Fimbriimonadales bacterium]|nr:bifunctional 3,4-dihydroxy-2-butanone-4-phosphate synthase/GTP cyclohydrolase II [Fimbriimonadales bacterium]
MAKNKIVETRTNRPLSDSPFTDIETAIEEIRAGKIVIVVDDPDRENEGDFVMAAEKVTPEAVNFMLRYGRGIPCVPTTQERLEQLGIPMMTKHNTSKLGTAMGETVDARHGTTTGISSYDRATTIRVFCDPDAKPEDLMRPGHVIPLRADPGGVLKRAGHTEATVDLCILAGLKPVGVLCEILDDDGTMARLPKLLEIAKEHNLSIITISDLISYRRKNEKLIHRVAGPIEFPTKYGLFTLYAYQSEVDPAPFLALVMGDVSDGKPVLTRVHSSCVTGDVLESLRCDCGSQVQVALKKISEEGRGCLLYIVQEGRGIGLINKLRAYELQEKGLDTVEANKALGFKPDLRDYGLGAQVLVDLGIRKLRLMTNNPSKVAGIQGYGLEIVEHIPLITEPTKHSKKYLNTKRDKLGHWIPEDLDEKSEKG